MYEKHIIRGISQFIISCLYLTHGIMGSIIVHNEKEIGNDDNFIIPYCIISICYTTITGFCGIFVSYGICTRRISYEIALEISTILLHFTITLILTIWGSIIYSIIFCNIQPYHPLSILFKITFYHNIIATILGYGNFMFIKGRKSK